MKTVNETSAINLLSDAQLRWYISDPSLSKKRRAKYEAALEERSNYRMSLNNQAGKCMTAILDTFDLGIDFNREKAIDKLIKDLTHHKNINLFQNAYFELSRDVESHEEINHYRILHQWFVNSNHSEELLNTIHSRLLKEKYIVSDFFNFLEGQIARIEFNQIMQQAEKYKEECSY